MDPAIESFYRKYEVRNASQYKVLESHGINRETVRNFRITNAVLLRILDNSPFSIRFNWEKKIFLDRDMMPFLFLLHFLSHTDTSKQTNKQTNIDTNSCVVLSAPWTSFPTHPTNTILAVYIQPIVA